MMEVTEGDRIQESLDTQGYVLINIFYDLSKVSDAFRGNSVYKFKPDTLVNPNAQFTRANLDSLTKGKQLDDTLFFIIKDGEANRKRLFDLPEINDVLNALSFFDMPQSQLEEMAKAATNHKSLHDTFQRKMTLEEIKAKVQEIPTSRASKQIKDDIYVCLPFEAVRKETVNESSIFKITIAGKELKLDAKELLKPDAFRAKFYEVFGILLPVCTPDLWGLIPLYLSSLITEDSHKEVESEDVLIREAVKSYIEGGSEVKDARELGAYQTFMRGRNGKVLVVNPQGLKAQIKDATSKEITDNFVQRVIIPAIKELYVDSMPYAIEQNGQQKKVRCWLLDAEKFDLSNTGSEEGEQTEMGGVDG